MPALLTRRELLAATASAMAAGGVCAQNHRPTRPATGLVRIVQLLDLSAEQQELSRDYSTGVRLAWAERQAELRRGAGGREVQLVSLETDGTPASLEQALASVRDDPSICALLGTVGDRLAVQAVSASQRMGLSIAHVAPWMADSRHDQNPQVLCLFASRELQMRHALRSLEAMGVAELGIVYSSPLERDTYDARLLELAEQLKLRTARFTPAKGEDAAGLSTRLSDKAPAVMLFVGGTLELARFTQGLSQRGLQRYVVSLSDVDLTTLMQVGAGKSIPLILTQVVPNPQTSPLAVARHYRGLLKELFDEPPSPLSLAGYLAGRYASQVLRRIEGPMSRAAVLAEFQKRPTIDLGGYAIDFQDRPRGSPFITQTLLTADGRLVG